MLDVIKPMLAEVVKEKDLDKLEGYAIEPKYDGSRNIFVIDFENNKLTIKRRNSRTDVFEEVDDNQFPEFNIEKLKEFMNDKIRNIILDGEMVSNNFASLMNRTHLTDSYKIKLAMKFNPVSFIVFDVLFLNDNDLTILPYSERRYVLETELIRQNDTIKITQMFPNNPTQTFETMLKKGFEGIVLKRLDSRYYQKRTSEWLKCKRHETETLEILSYDTKSNSRPQKNRSIQVPVLNLITEKGRLTIPRKEDMDYYYAHKPKLVEVEFQELSENNKMRFPKFVRFVV